MTELVLDKMSKILTLMSDNKSRSLPWSRVIACNDNSRYFDFRKSSKLSKCFANCSIGWPNAIEEISSVDNQVRFYIKDVIYYLVKYGINTE